MTSWELIRDAVLKCSQPRPPGSVGHTLNLIIAIDVYMAVRGKLKDRKRADIAFNADGDVGRAMSQRRTLEGIAR